MSNFFDVTQFRRQRSAAVPLPQEMPADTGCFVRVFVQRFLERRLEGVGVDLAPKRAMEAAAKSPTAEQPAGVCQRRLRVFVQTVLRPAIVKGFVVPPKRWIVERTCGWLGRYRRHIKDYGRNATSSEALIAIAMTRKMLRRLASDTRCQSSGGCGPGRPGGIGRAVA